MAINFYKDKAHDFVGIRITKTIEGKINRKYYSFRKDGGFVTRKREKELEAEARELLATWVARAEEKKRAKLIGPAGDDNRPKSALGARGITASFSFSMKGANTYPHPIIIVRGGGEEDAIYYFAEEGFDKVMQIAIDDHLQRYKLPKSSASDILDNMNVIESFRFVRARLNKKGKNITVKQMKEWGLWI